MVGKRHLVVEEKQTILNLSKKGFSSREIGEFVDRSYRTVIYVIKCFDERQNLLPLPRSGRPRISTKKDDRRLLRNYKSDKKKTARKLQDEWHIDACSQTIRNRLTEQGLNNYSTTKKPQLSSKNVQQRLEFCKKYESWTVEDWNTVVFSDETNIQAEPNGGHRKVWRKPNEKLSDFALNTSRKFPTSIMIWGCISAHGMGDFHTIEGRLKGE